MADSDRSSANGNKAGHLFKLCAQPPTTQLLLLRKGRDRITYYDAVMLI